MALISHGEWLDRFGDDADLAGDLEDDPCAALTFRIAIGAAADGLPAGSEVLPPFVRGQWSSAIPTSSRLS